MRTLIAIALSSTMLVSAALAADAYYELLHPLVAQGVKEFAKEDDTKH